MYTAVITLAKMAAKSLPMLNTGRLAVGYKDHKLARYSCNEVWGVDNVQLHIKFTWSGNVLPSAGLKAPFIQTSC